MIIMAEIEVDRIEVPPDAPMREAIIMVEEVPITVVENEIVETVTASVVGTGPIVDRVVPAEEVREPEVECVIIAELLALDHFLFPFSLSHTTISMPIPILITISTPIPLLSLLPRLIIMLLEQQRLLHANRYCGEMRREEAEKEEG